MSFLVEIPSIFTKATQIPSRFGNTTLTGNETIQGNMVVNGSLTLSGTMNNTDITYQSLDISSSLTVRGDTHLNSVFAETLEVDGATVLSDVSAHDLDLSGSLMVEGSTLLSDVSGHDLDLSGSLMVEGSLDVTGLATFSGGISGENFSVADTTGNTTVGGTLDVVGLATFSGGISGENFSVEDGTGNTIIAGTLDVTGLATFSGGISTNTVLVSSLPTDVSHATTKGYVDASLNLKYDTTTATSDLSLKQNLITSSSDISLNSLHVYGNFIVDGLWVQLGQDIDGEEANDRSGRSVSINADGTIVAIGAFRNDGVAGTDSGHTRVYKYNDISWVQLGQDIDGEDAGDWSGYSVSINADGTIVAIGAESAGGAGGFQSGHTRVYKYNDISWVQLGQDIDGESNNDHSGHSVSINYDGTIVATGAYWDDGNGADSGHTRVYKYNDISWVQLGQDIDGEAGRDESGTSVSINADGTIVAIGAEKNSSNRGHTRVYKYNDISWVKLGQDIDGEGVNNFSGASVSINSDGTIVAIGAYYNSDVGTYSGHTRVYKYNNTSWVKLGQDIDGEAAGDYSGTSVSINSDGTIVAIGANFNDGGGTNSGHTRVYKYNNTSWVQLGLDIDGESPEDRSGYSVSINSDGTMVAIGAIYNKDGGADSGYTRVYKYNGVATTIGGTLGVTGLVSFSGGISVTGDTTLTGTTTINKNITLTANNGDLIFNNQSISSGGTGESSILFRSGNNPGGDYGYIQYKDDNTNSNGESARLTIGTSNDADDHIILQPSGKVGIKTTTPVYDLDVNGTLSATGLATFTGGISGENFSVADTTGNTSIGGTLSVTGTISNGGFDFMLGANDQVSRGNSGSSRALVKATNNILSINYGSDFTGGTQINGNLSVTGDTTLTGTTTITKNITLTANNGDLIFNNQSISSGGTGESSILFRSGINAGSDYGYIQYKDDNTNSNGESARLTIGTSNDADDHIILQPSGKVGIKTTTPVYDLDVNGTLGVSGNITSPKFRSFKPVNGITNVFPGGSSSTKTQLASNITLNGGTIILIISVTGFADSGGLKTLSINLWYNGVGVHAVNLPFYFNQTQTHMGWSSQSVYTGAPARTDYNLEIIRNTTSVICDANDFINVTILEMPY
jgi:cytoskeletal protein CcmA (bactofilin family)